MSPNCKSISRVAKMRGRMQAQMGSYITFHVLLIARRHVLSRCESSHSGLVSPMVSATSLAPNQSGITAVSGSAAIGLLLPFQSSPTSTLPATHWLSPMRPQPARDTPGASKRPSEVVYARRFLMILYMLRCSKIVMSLCQSAASLACWLLAAAGILTVLN